MTVIAQLVLHLNKQFAAHCIFGRRNVTQTHPTPLVPSCQTCSEMQVSLNRRPVIAIKPLDGIMACKKISQPKTAAHGATAGCSPTVQHQLALLWLIVTVAANHSTLLQMYRNVIVCCGCSSSE